MGTASLEERCGPHLELLLKDYVIIVHSTGCTLGDDGTFGGCGLIGRVFRGVPSKGTMRPLAFLLLFSGHNVLLYHSL